MLNNFQYSAEIIAKRYTSVATEFYRIISDMHDEMSIPNEQPSCVPWEDILKFLRRFLLGSFWKATFLLNKFFGRYLKYVHLYYDMYLRCFEFNPEESDHIFS